MLLPPHGLHNSWASELVNLDGSALFSPGPLRKMGPDTVSLLETALRTHRGELDAEHVAGLVLLTWRGNKTIE